MNSLVKDDRILLLGNLYQQLLRVGLWTLRVNEQRIFSCGGNGFSSGKACWQEVNQPHLTDS